MTKAWDDVLLELLRLVPDPFNADPVESLVAVGLATRRAWLAHHRLAPHMAATPGASQFRSDAISLMAALFERLGLSGEEAGVAFHGYATFMVGAVLYAAANRTANLQLTGDGDPGERLEPRPEPAWTENSGDETRRSLDTVSDFSILDPERDEELFDARPPPTDRQPDRIARTARCPLVALRFAVSDEAVDLRRVVVQDPGDDVIREAVEGSLNAAYTPGGAPMLAGPGCWHVGCGKSVSKSMLSGYCSMAKRAASSSNQKHP